MKLRTGTYTISSHDPPTMKVVLQDSAEHAEVTLANVDKKNNKAKWIVAALKNGKYTLENQEYHGKYASKADSGVVGATLPQQWDIQETTESNSYRFIVYFLPHWPRQWRLLTPVFFPSISDDGKSGFWSISGSSVSIVIELSPGAAWEFTRDNSS
ncbi:hypothetical protein OF83DRAFT_1086848 [Amylostereum chailletii]|nr:hypothetical protein OF83DRAFT_1086848 [Amylostereum chailletii]